MAERFSLIEFFKEYPDEASAERFFTNLRWGKEIVCPHCGGKHIVEKKNRLPMPYRCKDCRKHFSVRTGTILTESKLPLQKWLLATYILINSKKGVSSIQLAEMLNTTQKTAWFLAHRIRETFNHKSAKFTGIVEVDETYIGGLEKNKHVHAKLRAGRGAVGKAAIVGIKSRAGQVKAFAVNETDEGTLTSAIRENVAAGSVVFTDQHRAYTNLDEFMHEKVKHNVGEFVRGMTHTNGIESFWAILKRGYYGIYHQWSRKHLSRYVNEYSSRFNFAGVPPMVKVQAAMFGGIGKHLSYKELKND